MKKAIAAFLAAVCCLFSVVPVYADRSLGNVNDDGRVDNLDAAQILKHDSKLVLLKGVNLRTADVNLDGKVNSLDAALVLKYDAGLNDGFGTIAPNTSGETVTVPSIESGSISVDPIASIEDKGEKVDVLTYEGSITEVGAEDEYVYEVIHSGTARMDISGFEDGELLDLCVYDSDGELVIKVIYCRNGEGATINDMQAGEVYTVKIKHRQGLPSYRLTIYQPKAVVDISGITDFEDSIEHKGQRNIYTYTPSVDGTYRFGVSGLEGGVLVGLYVFDSLGETVAHMYHLNQDGEGVTVNNVKAGETYEVQVRHYNGFGTYTLNIGAQKETVDIGEYREIKDSIQYVDQRNVYTFTADVDGRYRFDVADMERGRAVGLYVYDSLGQTVASVPCITNGGGATVKDLKAGQVYEVHIVRYASFIEYTLKLWTQKPTTDINSTVSSVFDSIEHFGQRNMYRFTADVAGTYTFEMAGLNSDCHVKLSVFDQFGEKVDSKEYCKNGDSITLNDLEIGETYIIQVDTGFGFSEYELEIYS